MLAAPVPPPGMRSRIAPNARDTPPPMECTPEISRAATPAIFWTTDAAIVVLPCAVSSASRAGEPMVVVGVLTVVVPAAPARELDVELVILRSSCDRQGAGGHETWPARAASRGLTRSGVAQ